MFKKLTNTICICVVQLYKISVNQLFVSNNIGILEFEG